VPLWTELGSVEKSDDNQHSGAGRRTEIGLRNDLLSSIPVSQAIYGSKELLRESDGSLATIRVELVWCIRSSCRDSGHRRRSGELMLQFTKFGGF